MTGKRYDETLIRRLWEEYKRTGAATRAAAICGVQERHARKIIAVAKVNGIESKIAAAPSLRDVRAAMWPPEPDEFGRIIIQDLPSSVLVLPDLQFPYAHPDWLPFLTAVKAKFSPSLVIGIGDEVDSLHLSAYEKDPETMQPSYEYGRALEELTYLYDLFPNVLALHSNHGRGRIEKARVRGGFLRAQILDYRQFIKAPGGWVFANEVRVGDVLFHHGDGEKKLTRIFLERDIPEQYGRHYSVVHGHRHELAGRIAEISVGNKDFWAAYTGALIHPGAGAFSYTKPRKAKLGCGVIIHGEWKRVRLILDERGRWTGAL